MKRPCRAIKYSRLRWQVVTVILGIALSWFIFAAVVLPGHSYADFPYTTHQLGENGKMGKGGKGGEGGEGGAGGIAGAAEEADRNGKDGKPGSKGGYGGTGGNGGTGRLYLRNMPAGQAFVNKGTLRLGGTYGARADNLTSTYGGDGGAGGGVLCIPAAGRGGEPYPDPDPSTSQGGAAGTVVSEGGDGAADTGAGGGGGRCSAPFVGGGNGGNGAKGKKGNDGAGDTGAHGANETVYMETAYENPSGQNLQIGGNGGKGGQPGQPGGGGGGGGGAGEYWGKPRGAGGKGDRTLQFSDRLAFGGIYGGGYLSIRTGGRLINQGHIIITTECNWQGGTCINSWVMVEAGGYLKNDLSGTITIGSWGSIESYFLDSTILNNGLIDNYETLHLRGSYGGSGKLDGSVALSGNFMPGDPIGWHTITGDYTQKGTLEIQIGGTDDRIPEYDFVDCAGQVTLMNNYDSRCGIRLVFLSSFSEADLIYGDWFDIIRYPSSKPITGEFASIDTSLAPLEHGVWIISYDEKIDGQTYSVRSTYQPLCMCDFEPDYDVDGSDLAIFMAAYGSNDRLQDYDPACDFINDGQVNQLDLSVFAKGFGKTGLTPQVCPDLI